MLLVKVNHNVPTTSSVTLAEVFGKQHKSLLRTIKNLKIDEKTRNRDFIPSLYMDSHGRAQPMYEITKDGFILLALRTNNKVDLKLKYLQAFNEKDSTTLLENERNEYRDIVSRIGKILLG